MACIQCYIIPFFCDYVTRLESQPKILPLDRLSPITLHQTIGHKSSTYLSPYYSLKASWDRPAVYLQAEAALRE